MNLIVSGIASIVDANTGYGFAPDYRSTHTAAAQRHAHSIRAHSVIALFDSIGDSLSRLVGRLRERRESRRILRGLYALDDHLLADIGLSRGELHAVADGKDSLDELLARSGKARALTATSEIVAAAPVIGLLRKVRNGFREFWSQYRERAEERRTLRHLLNLDQHLLRDIGLNRGDLIAVEMGQLSLARLEQIHRQRQHKIRILPSAREHYGADRQTASNTAANGKVTQCA